jgi:Putative phage metallopeptidase
MGRKKAEKTDERDPKVAETQDKMLADEGHKANGNGNGASNGKRASSSGDEPSNRKSIGYEKCGKDVDQVVKYACQQWHNDLVGAGVTIGCIFARAYDRHGERIPAIKVHGFPALAKISITNLEDRVRGLPDAKLVIDGNEWDRMNPNARAALVDHELEHLMVGDETDDFGLPKLKIKQHDWQLAGFYQVAERQRENAPEVQAIAAFREDCGQLLLGFMNGTPSQRPVESAEQPSA